MPWLEFADLHQDATRFDAAVAQTPAIDHFCSSSDWVLPAQAAFSPDAQPFIARYAQTTVALMTLPVTGGRVAVPLEAGWGLAAPIIGPDPREGAEVLAAMLEQSPRPPHGLYLSGIAQNGPWFDALLQRFGRHYRLGLGATCGRRMADLSDGFDGFLSRRSAKFRANGRRAWRKAQQAGFRFEYHHQIAEPLPLFERIMAMEATSWKGETEQGVNDGAARDFYRQMTGTLAAKGALRVVICTLDGEDAGFIFGGVLGDTYRGLQVSYVRRHRPWSLGNLLQWAMVRWLCETGVATYDLGTTMDYKLRWAEQAFDTVTLALTPRPAPRL
jgi:CelD/BcsL family acetyltransferase involved in cellulose biosynthesis